MAFLRADIELAFTFLRTAEIEAASDPEHCQVALANVRAALDTIHGLEGQIEDREIEATLCNKRDELEATPAASEGKVNVFAGFEPGVMSRLRIVVGLVALLNLAYFGVEFAVALSPFC